MSGSIIEHEPSSNNQSTDGGGSQNQGADRVMIGINYGLMLLGNIIGVTSIIALIIAYARRDDAPSWIRSHYEFQIATFWGALIGIIISTVLIFTVILSLFGILGFVAIWLWVLLRNAVGLLRLLDGRGIGNTRTMWV